MHRLVADGQAAALEAAEDEQVLDQPEEAVGLRLDVQRQLLAGALHRRVTREQLGSRQNGRDRRPQLVRHHAHERLLELASLALLGVDPGPLDRLHRLVSGHLQLRQLVVGRCAVDGALDDEHRGRRRTNRPRDHGTSARDPEAVGGARVEATPLVRRGDDDGPALPERVGRRHPDRRPDPAVVAGESHRVAAGMGEAEVPGRIGQVEEADGSAQRLEDVRDDDLADPLWRDERGEAGRQGVEPLEPLAGPLRRRDGPAGRRPESDAVEGHGGKGTERHETPTILVRGGRLPVTVVRAGRWRTHAEQTERAGRSVDRDLVLRGCRDAGAGGDVGRRDRPLEADRPTAQRPRMSDQRVLHLERRAERAEIGDRRRHDAPPPVEVDRRPRRFRGGLEIAKLAGACGADRDAGEDGEQRRNGADQQRRVREARRRDRLALDPDELREHVAGRRRESDHDTARPGGEEHGHERDHEPRLGRHGDVEQELHADPEAHGERDDEQADER